MNIFLKSSLWEEKMPDIQNRIKNIIDCLFETSFFKSEQRELNIVLGDNKLVQRLNRAYRQKDKPTNVLSFPFEDDEILGDVVLAFETIYEESKEQGIEFFHHVSHLIIHGMLHLLGYDHQTEETFEQMKQAEITLLQKLNMPNPYH